MQVFSSLLFVTRLNLRHSKPSLVIFAFLLLPYHFAKLEGYYFEVSFDLKVIRKWLKIPWHCSFNTLHVNNWWASQGLSTTLYQIINLHSLFACVFRSATSAKIQNPNCEMWSVALVWSKGIFMITKIASLNLHSFHNALFIHIADGNTLWV